MRQRSMLKEDLFDFVENYRNGYINKDGVRVNSLFEDNLMKKWPGKIGIELLPPIPRVFKELHKYFQYTSFAGKPISEILQILDEKFRDLWKNRNLKMISQTDSAKTTHSRLNTLEDRVEYLEGIIKLLVRKQA